MRRSAIGMVFATVVLGACGACGAHEERRPAPPPVAAETDEQTDWAMAREAMVSEQIEARGIRDERVLAAMRTVPRHRFVDAADAAHAYEDHPIPIGHAQTISQPFIVASMTELAGIEPGDRVLEIGTGSGYQAAVLAAIGAEVYSIEIVAPLGHRARAVLEELGYDVHLRIGDGYGGWPENAPFQAILLTAAPPQIPEPLLEQLAEGGTLVAPEGRLDQELVIVDKHADGTLERRTVYPVRFVPMTGRASDAP